MQQRVARRRFPGAPILPTLANSPNSCQFSQLLPILPTLAQRSRELGVPLKIFDETSLLLLLLAMRSSLADIYCLLEFVDSTLLPARYPPTPPPKRRVSVAATAATLTTLTI